MIASNSKFTSATGVIRVTEKQIQAQNAGFIHELDQHVYGMTEVKKALGEILSKPKIPLVDSSTTPLGTILIGGPTGIGKTKIVESLAEILLGNPDALTHISCDTLQEPHSVSVLVGSPPSYVGYGEPTPFADTQLFKPYQEAKQNGMLHELVRGRDGFAIVLFDEIEKAHPDVSQALLNAMSKGEIRLRSGKETNNDPRSKIEHSTVTPLRNTIFIFTSNAGETGIADSKKKTLGFTSHESHDTDSKTAFKNALQRAFSREFLGRIEYKIRCESYTEAEKTKIITLLINKWKKRLTQSLGDYPHRIDFDINYPEISDHILSIADAEKGARDLGFLVQTKVFNTLQNGLPEDFLDTLLSTGYQCKIGANTVDGVHFELLPTDLKALKEDKQNKTEEKSEVLYEIFTQIAQYQTLTSLIQYSGSFKTDHKLMLQEIRVRLRELGVTKAMLNQADMLSMQRYIGNLEKYLQTYQNITVEDLEAQFGFEVAVIRSMLRYAHRRESLHKTQMTDTMRSLLKVIGIEELTYHQMITLGILIQKTRVDRGG